MKSAMYFGEVRMSKTIVRVSVIKELIRKRGLTKDEFIKRSGMSHGTFYNTMKTGKCTPENAIKIARALDVSPIKIVPYVSDELRLTPLYYESIPATSRVITPEEINDLVLRIFDAVYEWAGDKGIEIHPNYEQDTHAGGNLNGND